ncbi:MAG: M28 family peptidase [Ignavibacteriales bacterium]|nr:M28 family peptidase [Ignavibacteriales bacterium]
MRNKAITILVLVLLSSSPAQDLLERAKQDIEFLASPEFAGRSYYADGNKKAAQYLKSRFREVGLLSVDSDYGQTFEIELNVVEGSPQLIVNDQELVLGRDFLPFATTGSGSGSRRNPIYYVRGGVFAPDNRINDFASVRSESAILIFDDEVPAAIQSDKSIDPRSYSRSTRIAIARELRASAAIFLVKKLMYSTPYENADLPVFDVLAGSLPTPVQSIRYDVEASMEEYDAENILGLLKGTAPTDTSIIVCAHFDHLGGFADSLYFPGANDNASGVAMLLALAQHFVMQPPKHSILFIAFSGEDVGLVGSKYYAEHPLRPFTETKFLLNLDMVASGNDGVMAVGGEDSPEFYSILKSVNDSLKLGPLYKRWNAPNSDHYFISQKGVKTFFLYANQGKQPYHSFADLPTTLDWKAFAHIFALSKEFISALAN